MALVEIENYSFAYPSGRQAVNNVSLVVERGSFCVICGPTGCGKSTLVRALKPELAISGVAHGTVRACGFTLFEGEGNPVHKRGNLNARESAERIGFVMQDPDAQLVCDTVWHELAFSLENTGMPSAMMRRRVAEIAHFFGMASWVNRQVETLSGGQKQLVNVASALALRPELLVLDEPTAQLDPHARAQLILMLEQVRRELGITIIMTTHDPESVARYATQWFFMGEMPDEVRYEQVFAQQQVEAPGESAASCVQVKDAYARYEKNQPWVLENLSLEASAVRVHAIVGGNGSGKSTLLALMARVLKPQRGKVVNAYASSQAFLPQDPKALFVCDTVAEELAEWRAQGGYTQAEECAMMQRFGLAGHETQHPYDLSGGQQQKLALAKLLLCNPQLLFLDEPTKGLDAASCAEIAHIVRALAREGRCIVFTTHDLDFARIAADEISMIFNGEVVCTQPAEEFFESNLVYRPHESSRLYGAYAALVARGGKAFQGGSASERVLL